MIVQTNCFLQRLEVSRPITKAAVDDAQVVIGFGVIRINSDRFIQPFDGLLPVSFGYKLIGFLEFFSCAFRNV
jgi:hypothetical protein